MYRHAAHEGSPRHGIAAVYLIFLCHEVFSPCPYCQVAACLIAYAQVQKTEVLLCFRRANLGVQPSIYCRPASAFHFPLV